MGGCFFSQRAAKYTLENKSATGEDTHVLVINSDCGINYRLSTRNLSFQMIWHQQMEARVSDTNAG